MKKRLLKSQSVLDLLMFSLLFFPFFTTSPYKKDCMVQRNTFCVGLPGCRDLLVVLQNSHSTFSDGLFSLSFLLFSGLLLPLLLLEDEELEDLESCLLKVIFDTVPFDTSMS